jgi:transcriptional regulator with XRE-family HTH domain
MVFGERIKQLRTEHQWTQEYVCEKLNISPGALSRYETSMYEPKSLELVKDFANLFGVSTDYLLGKSDIRNPEEYKYAYNRPKEAEGLSDEEVNDALRFYKEMKKKIEGENK